MPSSPAGVSEQGLALLRERLQSIPDFLEGWARSPEAALAAQPRIIPRRVVATGLGSSEAHARYLVWLLNRFTDIPAEFLPTGALLSPEPGHYRDRTLVVFSQGLSAHARIALSRRSDFASTVLFTAASLEGLRRSGKQDREDCLQALLTEGAEVIRFPLEDEYTLLIRVVGPALGFWRPGFGSVPSPETPCRAILRPWEPRRRRRFAEAGMPVDRLGPVWSPPRSARASLCWFHPTSANTSRISSSSLLKGSFIRHRISRNCSSLLTVPSSS